MPRIARLVIPGIPHHVIQRGNRRQPVFFSYEDKSLYLKILKTQGEMRTGRPLGDERFVRRLEEITGPTLLIQRPGRKPRK